MDPIDELVDWQLGHSPEPMTWQCGKCRTAWVGSIQNCPDCGTQGSR